MTHVLIPSEVTRTSSQYIIQWTTISMNSSRRKQAVSGVLVILVIGIIIAASIKLSRPARYDAPRPAELEWPDMRVDVNTAPAPELAVLPGIGPKLARRIIENRDVHGPFDSLNDLQRVSGIGPRTVEVLTEQAVAEHDELKQ